MVGEALEQLGLRGRVPRARLGRGGARRRPQAAHAPEAREKGPPLAPQRLGSSWPQLPLCQEWHRGSGYMRTGAVACEFSRTVIGALLSLSRIVATEGRARVPARVQRSARAHTVSRATARARVPRRLGARVLCRTIVGAAHSHSWLLAKRNVTLRGAQRNATRRGATQRGAGNVTADSSARAPAHDAAAAADAVLSARSRSGPLGSFRCALTRS